MGTLNDLTLRQLEILKLLSKGLSNKEIANLLDISLNTVKVHVSSLMRSLEVENRTEAAFAYKELHDIEQSQKVLTTDDYLETIQPITLSMPVVAALALENRSQEAFFEHIGESISEDLLIRLSSSRLFNVISFRSSRRYSHEDLLDDVIEKLHCDYLITGSVRWQDDAIKLNIEFIRCIDKQPIWRDILNFHVDDIVSTLQKISTSIASSINIQITEDQALSTPPITGDIWHHAMKGLWYLNQREKKHCLAALHRFETCLEQQPTWALLFYARAMANYQLFFEQWCEPDEIKVDDIEADAKQSIRLDPLFAEGHLAFALSQIAKGQMMVAYQSLVRALELNPSLPRAHSLLGQLSGMAEDYTSAIKHLNLALRMNPRDPERWSYYAALAMTFYAKGEYSKAISYAGESLSFGGHSAIPHIALIASYSSLHEKEKAIEATQKFKAACPTFNTEGLKLMLKGAKPEAVAKLTHLLETLGVD